MFLEQVSIYIASLTYLGRGGKLVYNHIAPYSNMNNIAVIAGPFKKKKAYHEIDYNTQAIPHTGMPLHISLFFFLVESSLWFNLLIITFKQIDMRSSLSAFGLCK